MRDLFRGYYRPSPDEFAAMWRESVFIFDTNVLLNIYRYTPNTRDDLFMIWEKLQDRIWIPYQAIFEYFENRELVISQQYSIHDELEQSLDKALEAVLNKHKKGHPFADIEAIKEIFGKVKEEAKAILQKGQDSSHNIQDHDIFLERITQLFDDKIGMPYSNEELVDIRRRLDKRYEQIIPPGYKDAKKDSSKQNDEELNVNKYGDGIIWFQMMDYAKSSNKSIIFITDDVKDDWWRREKGRILGPRPELIKEIYDDAKTAFYMYTADNFIKRAQELFGIQVRSETIKEVRDLRKQDEEKQKYSNFDPIVWLWANRAKQDIEKEQLINSSIEILKWRRLLKQAQLQHDLWVSHSSTPGFASKEEISNALEVLDDELKQDNSDDE